jgi:hypothetical protein
VHKKDNGKDGRLSRHHRIIILIIWNGGWAEKLVGSMRHLLCRKGRVLREDCCSLFYNDWGWCFRCVDWFIMGEHGQLHGLNATIRVGLSVLMEMISNNHIRYIYVCSDAA